METAYEMTGELNDYSGPFQPELSFDCFSREFLLRLTKVWQYAWLQMGRSWYETVQSRWGDDAANACEYDAWMGAGDLAYPRLARMADFKLETVTDSLKALQLSLNNPGEDPLRPQARVIGPNHVIWTVPRCQKLEFLEESMPERIKPVCEVLEPALMSRCFTNPKVKIKALKLPPRLSKDEIACQWEIILEEPAEDV